MWLIENDLQEEALDRIKFYDKGYAFFRYCMDSSIDEEQIVHLIKFMKANNVNDSRDMDKNKWRAFIKQYGSKDIKDLLQHSGDMIHIPDLMDELSGYSNILITGGGINECLKEVELALDALDKKYGVLNQFTY
jgi:hypothetical protein